MIIVKLGDTEPEMIEMLGDFEAWIAAGLGCPARVVDPRRGQALPEPGGVTGAVITGSHAMVTERAGWSEATAAWLVRLVERGVPVLGICYGHQLLAHALGGEVADHPAGLEIGTTRVHRVPAARRDRLFSALPDSFAAQVVHRQTVRRLPEGATILAANEHDPHQAVRFGANAWGVQFHPEFSVAAMRGYVNHMQDSLRQDGMDPEALAGSVRPTPDAAGLLAAFAGMDLSAGRMLGG